MRVIAEVVEFYVTPGEPKHQLYIKKQYDGAVVKNRPTVFVELFIWLKVVEIDPTFVHQL
jgi:hypothetical protein